MKIKEIKSGLTMIVLYIFIAFLFSFVLLIIEKTIIMKNERVFNDKNQQLICKDIRKSLTLDYNKVITKTAEDNDDVLLKKNLNGDYYLVSKEDYIYDYEKEILILRKKPYIYFYMGNCVDDVYRSDVFINIKI